MTEPTDVDVLRKEALDALRILSDNANVAKDALSALLRDDPDIVLEEGHPFSDHGFMARRCGRIDEDCQALLYMVTGLYGRMRVAEMAGLWETGHAEPVQ